MGRPEGKLAEGKVAVVTGASRGIGRAIAERLAAEGARVACVARTVREGESRAAGALTTTIEGIRAAGGEAAMVAANLAEEEDCLRALEETRAAFGPIDILVNNAVTNFAHPVAEFPSKRWAIGFAVNVHAPFLLSREAIPGHARAGRRRDREHLLGRGDRPRPRPLRARRLGRDGRALRLDEGRAPNASRRGWRPSSRTIASR